MRRSFEGFSAKGSMLAMFTALLIAAFCLPVPAQATTDQYGPINRSIVYVSTIFPTTVSVPWDNGAVKQYSFTRGEIGGRCSGSIVTKTGYILTASHCIQPGELMVKAAIDATKQAIVADGFSLGENPYIEGWKVSFGTPSVTLYQPQRDQQGAFSRDGLQARIVDSQTPETGDNALLQLQGVKDLIPLPIARNKPAVGESVRSFGFPALTDAETSPKLQDPTFKPLTITRHATTDKFATPVLEADGEILGGMSGGPVMNANGEVVGVNSRGFTSMSVSYVTDTDDLNKFLRDNSVDFAAGTSTSTGSGDGSPAPGASGGSQPSPGPASAPNSDAVNTSSNMPLVLVIIGLAAAVIAMLLFFVVLPKYKRRTSPTVQSRPGPMRDNDNNPSV
jgi:serine protease Do